MDIRIISLKNEQIQYNMRVFFLNVIFSLKKWKQSF